MQITAKGVTAAAPEQRADLRAEFAEKKCVVLRSLIEERLLRKILDGIESAQFYANSHRSGGDQEFATDLTVRENALPLHLINLLLNNRVLFESIEQITGCPSIGNFGGRIYKNLPNDDHHLEWHDDMDDSARLVAISVNLSTNRYGGGVFQIREKSSRKIFREVECQNAGDAHIFHISPLFEHRVTPTEGKHPRIAAAGWFFSGSNFLRASKIFGNQE